MCIPICVRVDTYMYVYVYVYAYMYMYTYMRTYRLEGPGARVQDRAEVLVALSGFCLVHTWRLLCSSFLVMACFLVRGYDGLPKKELHRSLQVATKSFLEPPSSAAATSWGPATPNPNHGLLTW